MLIREVELGERALYLDRRGIICPCCLLGGIKGPEPAAAAAAGGHALDQPGTPQRGCPLCSPHSDPLVRVPDLACPLAPGPLADYRREGGGRPYTAPRRGDAGGSGTQAALGRRSIWQCSPPLKWQMTGSNEYPAAWGSDEELLRGLLSPVLEQWKVWHGLRAVRRPFGSPHLLFPFLLPTWAPWA